MTVETTPDDGGRQLRAMVARVRHLLDSTPGEVVTVDAVRRALAGPLTTVSVGDPGRTVRPSVLRHRRTTVHGMLYTAGTRETVWRWLTQEGAEWWVDQADGKLRVVDNLPTADGQYRRKVNVVPEGWTVVQGVVGEWYLLEPLVRIAAYDLEYPGDC